MTPISVPNSFKAKPQAQREETFIKVSEGNLWIVVIILCMMLLIMSISSLYVYRKYMNIARYEEVLAIIESNSAMKNELINRCEVTRKEAKKLRRKNDEMRQYLLRRGELFKKENDKRQALR